MKYFRWWIFFAVLVMAVSCYEEDMAGEHEAHLAFIESKKNYDSYIVPDLDVSRVVLEESLDERFVENDISPAIKDFGRRHYLNETPFDGIIVSLGKTLKTAACVNGKAIGEVRIWKHSGFLISDSETRWHGVHTYYNLEGVVQKKRFFTLDGEKGTSIEDHGEKWIVKRRDKNNVFTHKEEYQKDSEGRSDIENISMLIDQQRNRKTLCVMESNLVDQDGVYYHNHHPHTGYVFFVDHESRSVNVRVIRNGIFEEGNETILRKP